MTSGMPNERTISVTSTETAQRAEPNEDTVAETDAPLPPMPKPTRVCTESRDVSVCSRNTRDSLRRNVSMRSNTFTASERLFLEQLTIEGTDSDVQKALETVEDEDLFFEHATPRNRTHDNIGLDINPSTSSAADDATRDAEAASVATSERRGLDKTATLSTLTDTVDSRRRSSTSSTKPPIPATILGSQRRREVLQRRRSDTSLNMATLWRAHETGLAVTSMGSQKSLLRRESSISSIGSNMSGLSVLFGNRPHPGAGQDVFRTEGVGKKEGDSKPAMRLVVSPRPIPPAMIRRSRHRRSKSASLLSPIKNLPKISEKPPAKPSIPQRAKSYVKRRSVTFHDIDEELEFDKDLESKAIDAVDAVDTIPKRSQMVRRAVSDSHIAFPQHANEQTEKKTPPTMEREASMSSIPSLHHGTPIRQDSISSIPSLHHGNPLRDSMSMMGQSTSSIPSLHQGTPLRDSMSMMGQSTNSIPSLHHGAPLRDSISMMGQSTSSIPSLHQAKPLRDSMSAATFASLRPANPLRQDSGMSFPSIHHGNPIRQESVSSFPSLHHGRPIRQDSVASSIAPTDALTQDQIVRQFGVTDEMASAWLKLSSSKTTVDDGEHRSSLVSNITMPASLPSDVTIPDAPTAPTISTAADAGELPDGATATTVATTVVENDDISLLTPATPARQAITSLVGTRPKPLFLRQASRNVYEGEGVEVTELDDRPIDAALSETDSYYYPYQPDNNGVFRTILPFSQNYGSIRTAGSFDDVSLFSSFGQQQRTSEVFREIRRSLSDDNLSNFVGGKNKEFLLQIPNSTDGTMTDTFVDEMSDDGYSAGWEMESNGRFDAWNILQDEYANGYGGGGTLGFKILGTSASDEASQPHVLSPPLMESLQAFLPPTKSGENFFMRYSMIRDGASLQTLLKRARGIQYSILAVETIDGEVFGSFTGQAWRKSWNYFGTGESFLWRMRHSRLEPTNGILDQAQKESEIDVFPYTGENDFIQLCTHDRIAVGGGIPEEDISVEKKTEPPMSNPLVDHNHDWGLGLALRSDLLEGSSSPCVTFGSPSLCKTKPNGDRFEIVNVELWAMTPCGTEEEAEKLELGKLFLGSRNNGSSIKDSLASTYTY